MLLRSHSMFQLRHKSPVIQQSIVIASNYCSICVEESKIDFYRCAECFEHSRLSEYVGLKIRVSLCDRLGRPLCT